MHAGMTCSQLEHVLTFYGLNNLCIGLNTFPSQKYATVTQTTSVGNLTIQVWMERRV